MSATVAGIVVGFLIWFTLRYVLGGFFTVNQNERAVKTHFGRAIRLGKQTTLDGLIGDYLNEKDKERYIYPQLKVIRPKIVGEALQKISADPEIADALFEVLETQNLIESKTRVTLLPKGKEILSQMLAAETIEEDIIVR